MRVSDAEARLANGGNATALAYDKGSSIMRIAEICRRILLWPASGGELVENHIPVFTFAIRTSGMIGFRPVRELGHPAKRRHTTTLAWSWQSS